MNHWTRNGVVSRACAMVLCVVGIAASVAYAGPLNPPPGPVQPTGKMLDQIEPRRIVNDLPGSANAVHVISVPGNYVLTGDISAGQGKHGILVTASDVTLDLNGFRLVGALGSLDGVRVDTPGSAKFAAEGAIKQRPPADGISGFAGNGVTIINAGQVSLAGLSVTNCGSNGISVTTSGASLTYFVVTMTKCRVTDCAVNGIDITLVAGAAPSAYVVELTDTDTSNNLGHGISITDSGPPPPPGANDIGALIDCINNVGAVNGGDGVNINLTALPHSIVNVRRSSFHNNVGAGLRVCTFKCDYSDNDCSFNGLDGFNTVADTVVIANCNASGNSGHGVAALNSDLTLSGGSISRNSGNGINATASSLYVFELTVVDNTGIGINASGGATYGKDLVVRGNANGFVIADAVRFTLVDCAVDDNTGNGVTTLSSVGVPTVQVALRRCSFSGNSGTGCEISDSIGGFVQECAAFKNGLVGIQVNSPGHVLTGNVAGANPAGNVFAVTPGNAVGPAVGAAGIVADNNFANTRP